MNSTETDRGKEGTLARRKTPTGILVGLLVLGSLPLIASNASATYTSLCSEDSLNFSFDVGHSDFDGFVIKDVKYGAGGGTKEYRIERANIKWVDIDVSTGGLVDMQDQSGSYSATCSDDTNGIVSITFDPDSGNEEGYTGVTIDITVQWFSGGTFQVVVVSDKGDSDRRHYLGVDADCSNSGSADPSDDGIRFNHTYSTGPAAEVRYESDMFGDGSGTNGATYEIVDVALSNRLCIVHDATEPPGDDTVGYAMKCTACTPESSSTQYTNGPWDYLSGESTWNTDVMLSTRKDTTSAASGTGDYITEFTMVMYDL